MAESSILWTTDGTGDGTNSGYTMAQVTEWMRMMAAGLTGADLSGVAPDYLNELAVTGTTSPVAVNTGAAIVYGFPYFNSASVNVVVSTPSTSTRVDLIVLEADWTAQTVRITSVAGTEGAGAPSLTQTAGTTWQMELAQASITTGGTITVTDSREWLTTIGDGVITLAKMADNSVDSDQYVDGSIDLAHMSANSVDSDQYVDGSIDPVHIGTLNLDDLDDVTETTPSDGQVLTYDSGGWINAASAAATFSMEKWRVSSTQTFTTGAHTVLWDTQVISGRDGDASVSGPSSGVFTINDTGLYIVLINWRCARSSGNSSYAVQGWVAINGSADNTTISMVVDNETTELQQQTINSAHFIEITATDTLEYRVQRVYGSDTIAYYSPASISIMKLVDG